MAEAAIAVVGLVIAAAGTAYGVVQGEQQKKQSEKARRAAERQQELEAARVRRQQARETRIKKAASINAAGISGTLDSSGLAGGVAGLNNQAASNSGYLFSSEGNAANISSAQQGAANAASNAGIGSGLAGFGYSAFQNAGALSSTFNNLFSPTPAAPTIRTTSSAYGDFSRV